MIEKNERTIKIGKLRDIGNIGHTIQNKHRQTKNKKLYAITSLFQKSTFASSPYELYISQLIHYSRVCAHYS